MTLSRTPRPKKCKACRERFLPARPLQSVCSPSCAATYARVESAKRERRETLERKAALKTRSQWMREAQAAVNRYVRLRDHGKPCISCGDTPEQKRGGTVDAGHFRSVGSAPHLRFLTTQLAAQCTVCNRHLGGNAVEFRKGLIARMGRERVEQIEAMQGTAKFPIEYLKRLKAVFNRRANRLAKRLEERKEAV